jgi:hypothetical protein
MTIQNDYNVPNGWIGFEVLGFSSLDLLRGEFVLDFDIGI